jgi:hypothetical protein
MSLTRRRFLAGGAQVVGLGAALSSAGIYELVDVLTGQRVREAIAASFPPEQHLMQNVAVLDVNAMGNQARASANTVPVVVPPLHSQVVTATLAVGSDAASLQAAQQQLEQTIAGLEARFAPSPSGLGIAVAWGLPYFSQFVPALNQASTWFAANTVYPNYLPVDNRASAAAGTSVKAVIDAIQFPSDTPPPGFPSGSSIRLEANHVAVFLRSDSLDNIAAGANAIFGTCDGQAGGLFNVTSVRKGFTGGGFNRGTSLPKQMATSAGIPGAASIPSNAELFMGFTSTQAGALGPGVIANLEAIPGLTDQWPGGYFAHGTAMHLSHLFMDLAGWYAQQAQERQSRMFNGGLNLAANTQLVDEGPTRVRNLSQVQADLQQFGLVGHSESLQPATRLGAALTDNYGNSYVAGTAVPERADFDSLDNPFFYSADQQGDAYSSTPAASLHFVVFSPTTDAFHRGRLGMDGHYPNGTVLPLNVRRQAGFNQFLNTTHRQNFLVPPRVHRSFPLVEFL